MNDDGVETRERSLGEAVDRSGQQISVEDLSDKGLNPNSLNPATAQMEIELSKSHPSTAAPFNPLDSVKIVDYQDGQDSSAEDYKPSTGSPNSQCDERSSENEAEWQEAPGSAKKKKRTARLEVGADSGERREALGAPLSLALESNPVIPLGLMCESNEVFHQRRKLPLSLALEVNLRRTAQMGK